MSPQAPCFIIATKLIHPSYTLQTQSQEIHRNTKEVCGKQSHTHHCLNKSHLASRMMVRQDFSLSIGIDVKKAKKYETSFIISKIRLCRSVSSFTTSFTTPFTTLGTGNIAIKKTIISQPPNARFWQSLYVYVCR